MRDLFMKFRKSEDGATLIEYGVALIVAIIVGGVALVNLAQGTDEAMTEAETVLPNAGIAVDWQAGLGGGG